MFTDDLEKRAASAFRVEAHFTLKREAARFSEKWRSIF
jgi:hypothetical protein